MREGLYLFGGRCEVSGESSEGDVERFPRKYFMLLGWLGSSHVPVVDFLIKSGGLVAGALGMLRFVIFFSFHKVRFWSSDRALTRGEVFIEIHNLASACCS